MHTLAYIMYAGLLLPAGLKSSLKSARAVARNVSVSQSVSQSALALAAKACQQRQQIVDTNAAVSGEVGAGRADSDHRCVITNAVC